MQPFDYRDFFGLVIGSTGQSDSQSQRRRSTRISSVQDDDNNFVRRCSRLFQTLIGVVQQLLQFLESGITDNELMGLLLLGRQIGSATCGDISDVDEANDVMLP